MIKLQPIFKLQPTCDGTNDMKPSTIQSDTSFSHPLSKFWSYEPIPCDRNKWMHPVQHNHQIKPLH